MRALWDGFLSALAALATIALCGVPAWFTHTAVQGGLAPQWAYAAAAGLAGVGLILTLAFGRKALRGVSPSRSRRRS